LSNKLRKHQERLTKQKAQLVDLEKKTGFKREFKERKPFPDPF
jgi:hypothetical protein